MDDLVKLTPSVTEIRRQESKDGPKTEKTIVRPKLVWNPPPKQAFTLVDDLSFVI